MTNSHYMNKRGNSYAPYTVKAKKGLRYKNIGMPTWVSPVQCLCDSAKDLIWLDLDTIDPAANEQRMYAPPPKDAKHSAQMALNTVENIITDPDQLKTELERITV